MLKVYIYKMTLLKKTDVYFVEKLLSSTEFLLVLFTSVVTYVLLLSDHHQLVKYILALCLFFGWKQYIESILSNDQRILPSSSVSMSPVVRDNLPDVKDTFTQPGDDQQWLKLDAPLYDFAMSLIGIRKFDPSLYNAVVHDLTRFSMKYYKQISDTQKNLYSNVTKHRLDIQDLQDIVHAVQEKLLSLEFVTTHVTYMNRLKIPQKIDLIRSVLDKRVRLLKAKREMIIDDD